jgi:hypothetical protein
MPYAVFSTSGDVILAAPQLQPPVPFFNWGHGLELAPISELVVVACGGPPTGRGWIPIEGEAWPPFYVQAIDFDQVPRFGGALAVRAWRF